MAKYDDDFDEFDDDDLDEDEDYEDDFDEETPRQRRKRQKAQAKARKKKAKARKKKHAELDDYDGDDYDDEDIDDNDINDEAESLADENDDYESDDDEADESDDGRHETFKDLIQGKGNTTKLLLRYFLPPVAGAVAGLIIGAIMFSGGSSSNQTAPTSTKGVQTVQSIQHAYSLTDIINSISHAQVNTLQKQLADVSPNANGSDQDYTDDQFNDAKNAVSNINGMTKDVINPFFDKVLTMPVTQSNSQKSTALDDAVNNTDKQASSSSASSKSASSSSASSSSSSNSKANSISSTDDDKVDSPVSKSVAQDKAAQIFTQESNRISQDNKQKTQIAGEILASGPANDLQQGGLKSGNAMAFEASASSKTFTYLVAVPYSTKTKTVNALFTMTIGTDKRIKSYHYVGYLNQINDQAKNFYNLIGK